MNSRRQFLKTVGLISATAAFPVFSKSTQKPNILFILVDDLGYGDLSSYGAKDLKTPNIDKLVESGIRFNNFYANCPVCSPTRASLLTGRYPDMVGVPGVIRTHWTNSWGFLSPKAKTLPQVLKTAGYKTGIIGKWHLGLESPSKPNERGFDLLHGFLGDMMDDYYTHRRFGNNYMRLNDQEIDPKGHATDLFSQWTVDYLNKQKNSDKPFFLYLAYNAPHTPIQPPEDWLEKIKKREKGIDDKRAKLVALIEHMDYGIGKVIKALKMSGLGNNTVIVFSSDNGGQENVGANNGGLTGAKQNMYEGGIKVPTCMVWPENIKPKSVSNNIALTMDFYPTLCAIAGAKIIHKIDGINLLPTLLGKMQSTSDRYLVWVRREGGHYGGRAYYAIRKDEWKLLQNSPFEPMKLYNLKEDPKEQNPLPKSHPKHKELEMDLRKHIIRSGAVPWENPDKLENSMSKSQ
jgi:arylsulfatase A-like enzyme